MPVNYFIPGIGIAEFDDGTSVRDAYKIAGVELPPPPSKGAELIPSLKRGTGGLIAGVGSAVKDIYPETGQAVEDYGKSVVQANPAAYPNLSDIHGVGSALGYAGERVAEGLPLAGLGLAATAVGGPAAGTGVMAGGMGTQVYGDVRDVQRETGQDNIPAALAAGAFGGALGAAGGVGAAVRGVATKTAEGGAVNLLKSSALSAGEQAGIGVATSAAERAAEGKSVTDDEALWDYANQGVSGAVVGGAFGAALHPFSVKKAPVDDTKPTDILKPDEFKRAPGNDLFNNPPTSADPDNPASPTYATQADLQSLQNERRRLSRAMADAADSGEYYKYQDALGKVDAAIAHPAMQFLERQQQSGAAFNADQQLDMMLTPPQKPQPAPQAPLQLPSPDKFNPPMYADAQGNVGRTPDLRAEAMAQAPEGSQGNLFTPNPDQPQTPAPVQGGGQPPTPLSGAGQPSLFGVTPTASVRSDFGPQEILRRLRFGNFHETDLKGLPNPQEPRKFMPRRIDLPYARDIAKGLSDALQNDNPFEAHRFLDQQHENLQGEPISRKGLDTRLAVIKAGRQLVDDYAARMADAHAQEAKQRAPQPGAQVTNDVAGQQANARLADANSLAAQQRQADAAAQQQHDAAQAAIQQRAAAEAQMAQANQTIVDSHRNAIVQKVLNNPAETNHAARVSEVLKRNGLDPELRPHEQEAADRMAELQRQRADATEAFSQPDMVEDTNPNQPIFEQRQEPTPAPVKESNTTRGRYAPENFRLETQDEIGFQKKAAAQERRESRVAAAEPTPSRDVRTRNNPRQGEMFTPTGRVKKSVDQSPLKVEQPKPETKGEQIKQAVAEKNAPTRERIKGTLKLKPKEEPNAEVRQEPEGNRAEHSDGGERRTPAEASGRDRVEEGREVQQASEADKLAESSKVPDVVENKDTTYDAVLKEAEGHVEGGLLKPYELQRLKQFAQGKTVGPGMLKEYLDAAVQRNSERAMAEASGTATKRRVDTGGEEPRPEYSDRDVENAAAVLRDRLDELGLKDAGLRISKDLIKVGRGMTAKGAYAPIQKIIGAAMGDLHEMSESVDHEVIHHLVNVGVLSKGEVNLMARAAARDEGLRDFASKYPKDEQKEELAAEAFARWANGDKSLIAPKGILGKIKQFFDAIRSALTGQGFRTAEDVFNAIESGEVGARERAGAAQSGGLVKARAAAIDALPEPLREPTRNVVDTLSQALRWGVTHAAFTEDLVAWATKAMPSAKKYASLMHEKVAEGKKYDDRFTDILDRVRGLDSKLQGKGDGTVNGMIQAIDEAGKWPFEPDWLTRRSDNPLKVEHDPALQAKFDALPKAAQDIVRDVFKTNHEMLTAQKDAVLDAARATGADGGKVLTEYNTLLGLDETKPYASRRRYGEYVAFARSKELKEAELAGDQKRLNELKQDEAHYWMQQYETFAEAQAAVRKLRDSGLYDNVLDARETDKASDQIIGARHMMLAFQQMRNYIKEQVAGGDMSKSVLAGMDRLANELYIRALRQGSSRKGELRRLGVAGGDMDMLRNFITQGRAQSHFIASVKLSDKVFEAMGEMKQQAKGSPNPKDMSIYNEMMLRHAGGLSYSPARLANKIKGFTGTYMIVTSPAFYLEQASQPIMMSLPLIGSRHGYTTSWGAMVKAYREMGSLSGKGWVKPFEIEKIKDPNVRAAVDELSRRGSIDVGQNMELGTAQSLSGNPVLGLGGKVLSFLQNGTRKIEALNRIATAMTSYRLERQKLLAEGKSAEEAHAGAVDYAYEVNRTTHGSYDSFNSPRWMRGSLLSTMTQFKKFQVMQASLLVKMGHEALMSKDPVEKAAMRRALLYTIGHAGVVGGMMGLPAMATIKWITDNLLSTSDEPFDLEQKLREQIGDPALANILMKGVPTLGTHGVDISDRVAMSTAFSLFPFAQGNTEKDQLKSVIAALAGPAVGGLGMQVADALDLAHNWQYQRALEKLLPKGVANVAKAYREATEGVSNRKGDTLMKPEDINFAESFVNALGLKTADISERERLSRWEGDKGEFFKDRTHRITLEFTQARKAGDTAGMQDARDRFRQLQDAKWKEGFPRSPMSTLINAAVSQRQRERATVGGVTYRPRSPGLRQAREEAAAEND